MGQIFVGALNFLLMAFLKEASCGDSTNTLPPQFTIGGQLYVRLDKERPGRELIFTIEVV